MISVWVTVEDYYKYINGDIVIGLSTIGWIHKVNLHIPLEQVVRVGDLGKKGVEIDIKIG